MKLKLFKDYILNISLEKEAKQAYEHYVVTRIKQKDRYKNIIYKNGLHYKGKELTLSGWVEIPIATKAERIQ